MNDFGSSLPRILTVPPGPASLGLARRLAASESRNVTLLSRDFPVFWESARGSNVRDADGNVFVDLTSGFGVALAGHGHPRIVEALETQGRRLLHGMGDVHPPMVKVELLERLSHLSPWGDARGVLATSGSEAVEVALKTAQLATGRPGIAAFAGGYHGLTLGSLAATERTDFREPFRDRIYPGVRFLPWPSTPEEADRCVGMLEASLAGSEGAPAGGIGAVIVEPIQGRAGVRIPPPGFLARLGESARAGGALLILDEIFTGFGRTGALFAGGADGVQPDLLCAGKALGGGLPIGVCLGPPAVMDAWPASRGEALHTSTFLGNPMVCAAALAFLRVLEEEELVAKAAGLGLSLLAGLRDRLAGVSAVREVRGRGLMIGIELAEGVPGGERWATEALRKGVIVLPAGADGRVVELTPPATLTEGQAEAALDVLGRVARMLA